MQGGIFPGMKCVALKVWEPAGKDSATGVLPAHLPSTSPHPILLHLTSFSLQTKGKWVTAAKSVGNHEYLSVTGEWNLFLGKVTENSRATEQVSAYGRSLCLTDL